MKVTLRQRTAFWRFRANGSGLREENASNQEPGVPGL